MRDGGDADPNGAPDDLAVEEEEAPADLRARVERRLGGRPLMVYLVLFAGAAALLLLLLIVWISAIGDDGDGRPSCLDITANDAWQEVLAGNVESIDVTVDQERPEAGPTIVELQYTDDRCSRLPSGADNRESNYFLIGVVAVYNETSGERIRVDYKRPDLPSEMLATSTPTPPPTLPPTEAPASPTTAPLPPTETPTATATATATATVTATVRAVVETSASPSAAASSTPTTP